MAVAVVLLVITGAATDTVSVRVAVPVPPLLVALKETVEFPAVVGVPEMRPVVALTERPAGKPDAAKPVGELLAIIW